MVRVFGLVIGFAVLVAGAMLIGKGELTPNKLQSLGFGMCNGQPCFSSLVPGKTPWQEIISFLQKNPHFEFDGVRWNGYLENGLYTIIPSLDSSGQYGSYIIFAESPVIGDDQIQNWLLPPLGQFIETYGIPCLVFGNSNTGEVWLVYPFLSLGVTPNNQQRQLRPESHVTELWFHDKGSEDCQIQSYSVQPNPVPWLGFTSVENLRRRGAFQP